MNVVLYQEAGGLFLVAPTTRREREFTDNYEAGQQIVPFVLLLLFVLAAGLVGFALLVVKIRRRRAEMRKLAQEMDQ
jgi:hypothetical protein